MSRDNRKHKRDLNQRPVIFNVETLAILDYSVIQNHMRFLQTSDLNIISKHIKLYYTFVFNGVNQRYQNSLSIDPDMRINILLSNILIPSVISTFASQ